MSTDKPRFAKGERRAVAVALCSLLLASCTSTGEPVLNVAAPAYNNTTAHAGDAPAPGTATAGTTLASAEPALAAGQSAAPGQQTAPQPLMASTGDTMLPDQVAYLPTAKPGTPAFPLTLPADAQAIAGNTPQQLVAPAQTEQQTADAAAKVAAGNAAMLAQKPAAETARDHQGQTPEMNHPVYVTAGEMPAPPPKPEKKGFLASLFGASPAKPAPAPAKAQPATPAPQPAQALIPEQKQAKPIITLASASAGQKQATLASVDGGSAFNGLPGVRKTALFEITRRSGTYDESDVDLNENDGGAYQVASAAGLARLAPNGLLKQTESVDVACLKPSLVRVLKQIENHYGRKMVVTSGYRNEDRNRQARGAKNSLHMYCAAADIQVPGITKWDLATYVRSLPGRGGVGTYCHTDSVHVDVGPERDWNWRCRRRG